MNSSVNNLVLSVMNDVEVYRNRLHCGYALLQGSSPVLTFKDIVKNEANKQRLIGSKFKPQDITEAAKIIQSETIEECIENIKDGYTGEKVKASIRRWFDRVNGNSYFSVYLSIPTKDGYKSLVIPFQYGYGSQPEFETVSVCEKIGLFEKSNKVKSELPVSFNDQGYMSKNRLFQSSYYF